MTEALSWVRDVILPGAGSILLLAALGYVREWAAKIRDERYRALVLALVRAAEQLNGPKEGEAKLDYVTAELAARKQPVDRAVIESVVQTEYGKVVDPYSGV